MGTEKFFTGDNNSGPNAVLVKVNGQKIYKRQIQQIENSFPAELKKLPQQELNQIVLTQLINNSLQQQAVTQAGFVVSRNQIDQYIYSIPEFHQKGQFSMAIYQQFLKSRGLNTALFLSLIHI